jgi:ribonuclease HII
VLTNAGKQKTGGKKRHPVRHGASAVAVPDGSLQALLSTAHIGVDEAGRGCLAGPVVAGAALFPVDFPFAEFLPDLDDSKKLSPAKREALAPLVRQHALAWGVGISWQDEIDAANVLNATFRAMSRAVHALAARGTGESGAEGISPLPPLVIDGNHSIPETQWALSMEYSCPGFAAAALKTLEAADALPPCSKAPLPLPAQSFLIRGDSRCPAIAAASILAKTTRDAIMAALDPVFPGYAFAEHKGYGTASHLAALETRGPCPLHRMTFRKVRPEERQLTLL